MRHIKQLLLNLHAQQSCSAAENEHPQAHSYALRAHLAGLAATTCCDMLYKVPTSCRYWTGHAWVLHACRCAPVSKPTARCMCLRPPLRVSNVHAAAPQCSESHYSTATRHILCTPKTAVLAPGQWCVVASHPIFALMQMCTRKAAGKHSAVPVVRVKPSFSLYCQHTKADGSLDASGEKAQVLQHAGGRAPNCQAACSILKTCSI